MACKLHCPCKWSMESSAMVHGLHEVSFLLYGAWSLLMCNIIIPHDFGAHVNIFSFKWRFSCSYRSSPNMFIIEPKMIIMFWAHSPISLNTSFFGVRLRQGTKLGTSMLASQEVYKFTMIFVDHVVVMHVSQKIETWCCTFGVCISSMSSLHREHQICHPSSVPL